MKGELKEEIRRTDGQVCQRWREWVAVFEAGLGDLSNQTLCNLRRFSNAAALCDEAWNIRARCQLATFR